MPSLSYTAWRRMIKLLVSDRRAYGTGLDRGCCFGKYKAVKSRVLLSELDKGINLSPISVSTRLRHLRFLRKLRHRRPNLEVRDQKNFDLFLQRESKGSQFSGAHREYSENNSNEMQQLRFILRKCFTLHVSGDIPTHHQEYMCCTWPQVSRHT